MINENCFSHKSNRSSVSNKNIFQFFFAELILKLPSISLSVSRDFQTHRYMLQSQRKTWLETAAVLLEHSYETFFSNVKENCSFNELLSNAIVSTVFAQNLPRFRVIVDSANFPRNFDSLKDVKNNN